jgi:hypothetical protein
MATLRRALSSLVWKVFDLFTRTPAQSQKTLKRIRPLLVVWFAVADAIPRWRDRFRRRRR